MNMETILLLIIVYFQSSWLKRAHQRALAIWRVRSPDRAPNQQCSTMLSAARTASAACGGTTGATRALSSVLGRCFSTNAEFLKVSEQHESNARGYVRKFPMAVAKAQGVTLTDVEGNEYFDCLQCAGTLAMGHNHPVAVAAAQEFFSSGEPMQALDLATPRKTAFMTELLGVLPDNLTRLHFASPAGTDALDAAVKLCKTATGRRAVVSFHGGYHGMGQATMAMMGNLSAKTPVPGLMGDTYFLPFPYHYRNPFGLGGEEGEAAVMAYIETALTDDESGIPPPACVVVEAVQGEGGVQPMSPWALRELRRITAERDIPLVLDEVQAGFCRTGSMFAFQASHEGGPGLPSGEGYGGIKPDVVCMSKAVGGGQPQAVIAFTEELNTWRPAAHTGTFRGNQVAMATGTAALRYMQENALWEEAERKGSWLREQLLQLQEQVPMIGDVRGRGLMLGVELVHPDTVDHNGVPAPNGTAAAAVQSHAFHTNKLIIEKGGRHGAVLRFLPPLTITDDELQRCFSLFADSVQAVAKTA